MNWKKKLLALGLSLALTLSLTACGQKTAEPEQPEEPAQTEEPAGRSAGWYRDGHCPFQNCCPERPHRHGPGGTDESERHGQ